MILTITPNVAVDKTYSVQGFRLDCVNRPAQTFTVAGGKGINVARVYQTLGGEAVATGFLGGLNGAIIESALASESIHSGFVRVDGESRLCIAIINTVDGSQTEINEAGPPVSSGNARDLFEKVRVLLASQRFDFVVMCGSLPPETPVTLYAELIELTKSFGVRTVLDASGEPLRMGLEAQPWMVKPNQPELQELLGRPMSDQEAVVDGALQLRAQGTEIEVVAVTIGSRGAIVAAEGEVWRAVSPPIKFASAVASGDSFVAAFLWSWDQELDADANRPEWALRLGTGAGAANAAVIGAGFCTRDSILAEAAKVQTQKLCN